LRRLSPASGGAKNPFAGQRSIDGDKNRKFIIEDEFLCFYMNILADEIPLNNDFPDPSPLLSQFHEDSFEEEEREKNDNKASEPIG
jgi:hypothetical protein